MLSYHFKVVVKNEIIKSEEFISSIYSQESRCNKLVAVVQITL